MGTRQPKVIAEAAFTYDMAETLLKYFMQYQKDGIVRVEVTDHGLWLKRHDVPVRHMLGLAEMPEEMRQRLARRMN